MICARTGLLYALIVFAIGVVLGATRVLWAAPRLGATWAVSIETPRYGHRCRLMTIIAAHVAVNTPCGTSDASFDSRSRSFSLLFASIVTRQ